MSNESSLSLRLMIYHPTQAGHVLAVIGGCQALGNWQQPRVMTLGPQRRLLSGARGSCWEYEFTLSKPQLSAIEYRYVIMDKVSGSMVWEREPNRFLSLSEASTDVIEVMDANFVSGMQFDTLSPGLFIGPYPQLPEDIDALSRHKVHAVLNVQTDADIALRFADFQALLGYYEKRAIQVYRLPIEDFNEADLIAKLPAAVHLLKELLDTSQRVYLHCTAGMGRSAAVAVAYFSLYHGRSVAEALAYVKERRPVICPNVSAIDRVVGTIKNNLNHGFPSHLR